ncbi:MAG: DUF86 domain-containing protein [Treponema sp.]|nr:DUF86 domain-containing protein [Treponema sp.]
MTDRSRIIIEKIKLYAVQAREFIGDMTFEEFSHEQKTTVACIFNLSQIGELAGKLDSEFTESTTHIPWRKIRGLRNRIVHDYEGIELNIVWDVLTDFLPELIDSIEALASGTRQG